MFHGATILLAAMLAQFRLLRADEESQECSVLATQTDKYGEFFAGTTDPFEDETEQCFFLCDVEEASCSSLECAMTNNLLLDDIKCDAINHSDDPPRIEEFIFRPDIRGDFFQGRYGIALEDLATGDDVLVNGKTTRYRTCTGWDDWVDDLPANNACNFTGDEHAQCTTDNLADYINIETGVSVQIVEFTVKDQTSPIRDARSPLNCDLQTQGLLRVQYCCAKNPPPTPTPTPRPTPGPSPNPTMAPTKRCDEKLDVIECKTRYQFSSCTSEECELEETFNSALITDFAPDEFQIYNATLSVATSGDFAAQGRLLVLSLLEEDEDEDDDTMIEKIIENCTVSRTCSVGGEEIKELLKDGGDDWKEEADFEDCVKNKPVEDYFKMVEEEGFRQSLVTKELLRMKAKVPDDQTSECPTYLKSKITVCYCMTDAPTAFPTPVPSTAAPTTCEFYLEQVKQDNALMAQVLIDNGLDLPDSVAVYGDDGDDGGVAGGCQDSTSWSKSGNPSKDCEWVGEKPDKRCTVKGEDGSTAGDWCTCSCA